MVRGGTATGGRRQVLGRREPVAAGTEGVRGAGNAVHGTAYVEGTTHSVDELPRMLSSLGAQGGGGGIARVGKTLDFDEEARDNAAGEHGTVNIATS